MEHRSSVARILVRLCVGTLAVLLLVGPASAKPKGQAGKAKNGHARTKAANHGAAVKVAAHCPVHGKAHGKLVSSIARDKSATVDDAIAACEAAQELDDDDGVPADDGGDDTGGDDTGGDDTGGDAVGDDTDVGGGD